jgi:hypothetical protein
MIYNNNKKINHGFDKGDKRVGKASDPCKKIIFPGFSLIIFIVVAIKILIFLILFSGFALFFFLV